jgi:predicted porin
MNKKLIALAVAGATIAPAALAQSANPVTLYGRVYVTFENVKASGGASPVSSRNRVSNQASLIGFRGTEDLGGGLKAFFQVESGAPVDTGATVNCAAQTITPAANGTVAVAACNNTAINGTFGSRNSGVGLQGAFGSILLGKWDTPFKTTTIGVDPFGDLTIAGITGAVNDKGNFDLRPNNTVQYWTPNVAGFSGRLHYSANEGKTAAADPKITSLSGTYSGGPIYAGIAWEKHSNRTGSETAVSAGFEEKGTAIFGTFTLGAVKIGAITEKFKKTNLTDQKAAMINLTYTVGSNVFAIQHARSKDGAASTAATQPDCKINSIGYFYNFTRRTTFVTHYTQVKNNAAATCNFGANALAITADNDPKGFAVGFRHTF